MVTTTTVRAAGAAEAAGFAIGGLLTLALAVGLIVLGVRMRRRGSRAGGVLVIVLGVVVGLGLLSSLTRGAAATP